MIVRDNLHIDFRTIDRLKKSWNLIVTPREAGKTSAYEYVKIYKAIKNGYGSISLYRYAKEITKHTLNDIENRINLYLDDNDKIKIGITAGSMMTSRIEFTITQHNKILPGRGMLLWLGLNDQVLKKTFIERPRYIGFDEYVLNPQSGERYIKDEMHKLILLQCTISRYATKKGITTYLMGNPTTKYTPFNEYFNVPYHKIKEGALIYGELWAVWCYKLKEKLKEKILKSNPNYQFDEYTRKFAIDGVYIYDEYRINNLPNVLPCFKIDFIIGYIDMSFALKYLLVYYNARHITPLRYIIKEVKEIKYFKRKPMYCFGFKNMTPNSILLNNENKDILDDLNEALCDGKVGFVNCFYQVDDLFNNYVKTI